MCRFHATATVVFTLSAILSGGTATAGEEAGAIRREGDRWVLRTATAERVVALRDGRFLLLSLVDGTTGRELVSRVSWFSKYGPDGGKAAVSLDGGPAETVDAYSADEIRGVCLWRKASLRAGTHALRIVVLGEGCPRSSGTVVPVDAIRVDPE
jgi:hypothetical protein